MANLKDIAAGTMVGFSANKTVDTAKADTATNRVDICKTKELYLNGERLGLTDAESSYLTKKVEEEYNARMTVSVSLSKTTLDKGEINTVKATIYVKWDGAVVEADSMPTVTVNNSATVSEALAKNSDGSYSVTYTNTDGFTVSVSATKNGITKSTSASCSAYYKYYYGLSTADSISAVTGLTAKGPQSSAAGTYNVTFTAGQYLYFAIPTGVNHGKLASAGSDGFYHAVEGVSDVPFIKQSNQLSIAQTNGTTAVFDVYRLASPQAASSHSITI